ncbi:MAG TPA: hypothetical protein VNF71_15895 [Acidimicrobiales bacterium]|nr:hypothetical protein [Acidimicrobiales bacterium]
MSEDEATVAVGYTETLDRIAGDLEAVEAALRRLDDGTYGRCGTCGRQIAEDEVERDPLAATCADHRGLPAPASASERAVGVLAGDDPLSLGREHPEG